MLVSSVTSVLLGIRAVKVTVEADIAPGMFNYTVVGLPGSSVRESRDRIKTAMRNSGFQFPGKKITVNLAPADIRKEGGLLDLPIASALLAASGQTMADRLTNYLISGELSLDGSINPVPGIVSQAYLAKRLGKKGIILPANNYFQGSLISGIEVIPVSSLLELVNFLNSGEANCQIANQDPGKPENHSRGRDLSDVVGQGIAKRAIEIAAAGAHNLILIGPPGTGKTMIAERITSIMPPPDDQEIIEINEIYSLIRGDGWSSVLTDRPFRSPHHSISYAGMIGGGNPPSPGEVTMAHNGVLFLDEFTEFRRDVIEALRQPLESGKVIITRSRFSFLFPGKFVMIATTNSCPCGNYGNGKTLCSCSFKDLKRYRRKLSGPILDRIDMQVEMPPPPRIDIISGSTQVVEHSNKVRERVIRARRTQKRALRLYKVTTNSEIPAGEIEAAVNLTGEGRSLLLKASTRLGLSARAIHRIMRIGRTIADLEDERRVLSRHIAEALHYRILDRKRVDT